jgi:hypothetical protein
MQATGSVSFGGTLFGVMLADIKTEDGHGYHFRGYFGEVGTPNVGYGTNFSGDFPGLDHIEGSCWFEVAAGSGGPGACQVTFWDSHGQIGTLIGYIFGGGFDVGLGGGSWNDAEWQATNGDRDEVELKFNG